MAGGIEANVCALANTPGISASIFGMWQATQAPPFDPSQ